MLITTNKSFRDITLWKSKTIRLKNHISDERILSNKELFEDKNCDFMNSFLKKIKGLIKRKIR